MKHTDDIQTDRTTNRGWALAQATLLLLIGMMAVGAVWAVGIKNQAGFKLDVGATQHIRSRYLGFIAYWTILGTVGVLTISGAAAILGRAFTSLAEIQSRLRAPLMRIPDWAWVTSVGVLCVVGGVLTRIHILNGAPLTDDESAYRFMAELIATGRLTADSMPIPLKLFFDRIFMINDGEFYAQYFIGWPALKAPGIWLGVGEYMNAFYSGLLIPPLYFTAKRLMSTGWARTVTVLYLVAPFTLVAAGTEMSHTTCLMALTYCLWFALRCADEDATYWDYAGVAFFFALAFLIRALTALGLGLPILGYTMWTLIGVPKTILVQRLVAFTLPATLMAGLFFWVNQVQNEDPFVVSYVKVRQYEEENEHRFGRAPQKEGEVSAFDTRDPKISLARTGMAVVRLLAASFGWPCLLLVLPFALGRRTRLLWATMLAFFAAHFFVRDAGIDTYGPVHFFEMMLPLLLLVGIAFDRLPGLITRLLPDASESYGTYLSTSILLVILAASAAVYYPIRLKTVHRVSDAYNEPVDLVERTVETPAIVFAPKPFTHPCQTAPAVSFVWWRPNNSPNYDDDILWVNHISLKDNKRLMKYFPDRKGYVLFRRSRCRYGVEPLDEVSRREARRYPIGGTNRGPRWGDAPPPPEAFEEAPLDDESQPH